MNGKNETSNNNLMPLESSIYVNISAQINELHNLLIENSEYKKKILELTNENSEYKKRNLELINDKIFLQDALSKNKEIIEELLKENAELKIKLEELEKHIITQDEVITEIKKDNLKKDEKIITLENEIIEIKKNNLKKDEKIITLEKHIIKQNEKINILEKHITQQNDDITELKNDKIFNKYLYAIQDANSYLKLYENPLSDDVLDVLNDLKIDRIRSCHYLNNKFNDNKKKEYLNSLYEHIINIKPEIKILFDDKYPDLLDEIAPIINKNSLKSTNYVSDLLKWWK
jgi:chromosome segregation ATPase